MEANRGDLQNEVVDRQSEGYERLTDDGNDRSSSFAYSQRSMAQTDVFVRSSIIERDIVATPADDKIINAHPNVYKGRIRRWPGVLLLLLIVAGSISAIAVLSFQSRDAAKTRTNDVQKRLAKEREIADGLTDGSGSDHISSDGQVNNPEVYPTSACQLPDYQSKNGSIYAVSSNGTEVPISIKGVNWFGMETGLQAPFGLWDNDQNGTTVYAVAQFLAKNKFNSVRLPLCVSSVLNNKPLEASIINRVTNRALDLTSYISLLQSVAKSLAFRQVSVMISMHTLDVMNAGGSLWYGSTVSLDQFLKAIDMLTKALCSNEYWNVIGIDVKNEPWEGTWNTGNMNDFKAGAELIGTRMLKGCSKWLVFVEGVNAQHTITLDGKEYAYFDWFGGGLQKAGDAPVKLPVSNKLVYAPHYYTPAVFPQYYLFGGGTVGAGNAINGYVELPDDKLQGRVSETMHSMFGYLNDNKGPAVLLGEFAGLYTKDAHPMKTTQRCTNFTINTVIKEGYAGAYMWSLNPESAYQYNPADTPGNYMEVCKSKPLSDLTEGAVDDGNDRSSFSYSQRSTMQTDAITRNTLLERDIVAAPAEEGTINVHPKRYKGRIRIWPGILLLIAIFLGALAAITYFSIDAKNASRARTNDMQKRLAKEREIADGTISSSGSGSDYISDDGQVNNPEVYSTNACQLPDYQSKNGKIYAVAANGTEVPINIKGVNWFGMETGLKAPFGLWDNDQNGTTVYAIAQFLAKNKFNSVRLPLCVSSILDNKPPETSIINRVTNRALDLTSYISLLQSVIKSLAFRQISVMISMHTLDVMNAGGSLWYGSTVSLDQFLKAIDMLTKSLCTNEYWNVIGIDVKNEPWEGTWNTGNKNDFKAGAELIGARILKGCTKWLVFVEGVNAQHTITLDGKEYGYYDWFGGGLQKAGDAPVKLPVSGKLVYAPHYYTPAVFPQYYFFGGGTVGTGNAINDYIELSDSKLEGRISQTMHTMFGYLNDDKGPAVLLGEFAGLYTKDAHPMKTTQRCTNFTINTVIKEGYAGAYMWS
ncbi:cell 5A endo-1,4-betaglucanase, partial [Thraustotheca clavata]